jgi:hypothetical protein
MGAKTRYERESASAQHRFIRRLGSLTDFRFFIIAIVVFLPPDFARRLLVISKAPLIC